MVDVYHNVDFQIKFSQIMKYVNYTNRLVKESLQIDVEYNSDTIDDDISKMQSELDQTKETLQKTVEQFQETTSTVSFSSVHDSIVDYLNKKASLEYLQLVKQARAGNSEISSQSNDVQPTSET